ncbi:MAG: HAMP domain-containing sensor histidine kinase, partial [Patescibacteria group bacterium]|nr:HAMP domain-containing sensor histidine kinase [Patescibacteria group bacterium]
VSRAVAPVILGGETIGAINVFRDITEEKALDQAKSDFLSLASHQLRTPLSASKWILETMSSQTQGLSDKQKRYLRDLAISNERLIGLVNGLLDVARIEAGRLSIYKKSVDILALLQDAIRSCRPSLEKKGQKINLIIPAKIKRLVIDPLLFSVALNNILNNACNFAPKNGKIDILIKASKGKYVISIRNYGPVIPKSEQPKVFSKFYRGRNSQVGSGLGLFITKAAVEANGGKIWFESAAGIGTTFYFTIPK